MNNLVQQSKYGVVCIYMKSRQSSTVSAKQLNSSKKLCIAVLISILLTSLFVGSSVYFWQKSVNEEMVDSLEQKIASLETANSIADWETYANKAKGYSAKYPQNTYMRDVCPDEELTLANRENYSGYGGNKNEEPGPTKKETCVRDFRYSLEIITHADAVYLEVPESNSEYAISEENIMLSGISGTKYTATWIAEDRSPAPLWYSKVLVEHNNKTYEIYFSDKENELLFDQILSTFEFTD